MGVTQILSVCEVSEERQETGDICYLRRRTCQIIMRSRHPPPASAEPEPEPDKKPGLTNTLATNIDTPHQNLTRQDLT